MSEDKDFHEAFLRANANAGFMSSVLADLVRRIMRASISHDGSQQYQAMEALKLFLGLVGRSENVSIGELIEGAVQEMTVTSENEFDRDDLRIARAATRYLLEMSCDDGFSKGRAAQRWVDVDRAIRARAEMHENRAKIERDRGRR